MTTKTNYWKADWMVSSKLETILGIYDLMMSNEADKSEVELFFVICQHIAELIALSDIIPSNIKKDMMKEAEQLAVDFKPFADAYIASLQVEQ